MRTPSPSWNASRRYQRGEDGAPTHGTPVRKHAARPPRVALLLLLPLCLLCIAADDADPEYPRIDPNNPGGERLGDDDGDDGFTGYPADPGEPGDAYHDTSSEYVRYSPNWNGSFIGGGALVGMGALRSDLTLNVDRGPTFGAFANWSSVSQIVDIQVQYLRSQYSPTLRDGATADFTRQNASASILLHPLFLTIIGGSKMSHLVANTYFLSGLGAEFNRIEPTSGARADDTIGYTSLGWRIGAGTGLYLDNPNDGGAFWLGVQFQRAYVQGDPNNATIGRSKSRENLIMLRLSYRWNGNAFAGFRGPRGLSQDAQF